MLTIVIWIFHSCGQSCGEAIVSDSRRPIGISSTAWRLQGRPEALQSAETTRPDPVTNGDESALGITHIGRNQVFTSVFVDFLQFKVIVI